MAEGAEALDTAARGESGSDPPLKIFSVWIAGVPLEEHYKLLVDFVSTNFPSVKFSRFFPTSKGALFGFKDGAVGAACLRASPISIQGVYYLLSRGAKDPSRVSASARSGVSRVPVVSEVSSGGPAVVNATEPPQDEFGWFSLFDCTDPSPEPIRWTEPAFNTGADGFVPVTLKNSSPMDDTFPPAKLAMTTFYEQFPVHGRPDMDVLFSSFHPIKGGICFFISCQYLESLGWEAVQRPMPNFACGSFILHPNFIRVPRPDNPSHRSVFADVTISGLAHTNDPGKFFPDLLRSRRATLHHLAVKVLPVAGDMCVITQTWVAHISMLLPYDQRDLGELNVDVKHHGASVRIRVRPVPRERGLGLRSHFALSDSQISRIRSVLRCTVDASGNMEQSALAQKSLAAVGVSLLAITYPSAAASETSAPKASVADGSHVSSSTLATSAMTDGVAQPSHSDTSIASIKEVLPVTPRSNLSKLSSFVQTASPVKRDRSPGDPQVGGKFQCLVVEGDEDSDEVVESCASEPLSASSVPLASASGAVDDPGGGGGSRI